MSDMWYSKREVEQMKLERNADAITQADAITLARTLLSPSAEDLREGGVHVSQVIGLEKAVNPTQARGKSKVADSVSFLPILTILLLIS
jgi:hypothetical protein